MTARSATGNTRWRAGRAFLPLKVSYTNRIEACCIESLRLAHYFVFTQVPRRVLDDWQRRRKSFCTRVRPQPETLMYSFKAYRLLVLRHSFLTSGTRLIFC
jgi:hypothetical protein